MGFGRIEAHRMGCAGKPQLVVQTEQFSLRRAGKTHSGRQLAGQRSHMYCFFRDRNHQLDALCLDDGQQLGEIGVWIGCRCRNLKGLRYRTRGMANVPPERFCNNHPAPGTGQGAGNFKGLRQAAQCQQDGRCHGTLV
jgi:hypothetical protein